MRLPHACGWRQVFRRLACAFGRPKKALVEVGAGDGSRERRADYIDHGGAI
jgi:hypothetical protein